VQLVRADDLARFGALGIVASMQPIHATSDRDLADRYWGASRVARAYPWRTLRRTGAVLAFGSDAPVEPIDPLLGIHAAVTRRRPQDDDAWRPEQRLTSTRRSRIRGGPAYAMLSERFPEHCALGCAATRPWSTAISRAARRTSFSRLGPRDDHRRRGPLCGRLG
jgi:hypothetical protein